MLPAEPQTKKTKKPEFVDEEEESQEPAAEAEAAEPVIEQAPVEEPASGGRARPIASTHGASAGPKRGRKSKEEKA